ncbi:MAG: YdcF family protein [Oscillospiraceae bacterium]
MLGLDGIGWKVLFILSILGFLFGLSPVFNPSVHLNLGNYVIMAACAVLALLAVFHSRLFELLKTNKAARVVFSVIAACAAVLFILAVVISVFMVKAANDKPQDPAAIIVLGCRVNGDVPSAMLMQRINAAYKCLEQFPEAVVIASGGKGADELVSEAECIRRELERRGIAPERIILEENSTSTRENMMFSRQILEEKGISGEIAIVSNEYHLRRAKTIAKEQGMDVKCCAARTVRFYLPAYWVREILGNVYEFLF